MEKSYGIINLSCVPVRSEPSEKAEMTNQLLFGETIQILQFQDGWAFIESLHDAYQGWMDNKSFANLKQEDIDYLKILKKNVNTKEFIAFEDQGCSLPLCILPGSTIYLSKKSSIAIGRAELYLDKNSTGGLKSMDEKLSREVIINIAKSYLNAPYMWGGRSLFGIDCSGFTQVVFKIGGYFLPRNSTDQVNEGKIVEFIGKAVPGDLAFFDDEEGNIVHVGIIMKKNEIIHASGKVRMDLFDHQGIYNRQMKKYTHKLRVIKNLLG